MRITIHTVVALVLCVLATAIAVPAVLALPQARAVPVVRLTVPAERARPALQPADHALGALVPAMASGALGNPFALRDRGKTSMTAIPEPPPPLLQLPEPPLSPFLLEASR